MYLLTGIILLYLLNRLLKNLHLFIIDELFI